jgi:hypothetical protein
MERLQNAGAAFPDYAEFVIGRRYAPTRWLIRATKSPQCRHISSRPLPSICRMRLLEFCSLFGRGISVLIEDSYLSRFFTKFVEIIAAGFATACSAYLFAQLVGPLPAARPTPAAVAAGSAAASAPVQPAPPVAAAVVDGQRASRPVGDAAPAQPAPKAPVKAATSSVPPAPKDIKTSTATTRGEKSAEALARAALASLDADRQAPADAPIRRASTAPVAAAPVEAAPHQTDLPPPRAADLPPAAAETPARHVATAEPLPPNAGASPTIASPQPETPTEEFKGLLSVPKRIFGLLRPGAPSPADEAPRPPLLVGTAAGE